jgi:coronin-1B/1C/6
MPKRGVNVHETEVMRAYKTVNDTFVEPISFIVPRKAEVFQEDIYPPTVGLKPAMSSGEWFSGKNGMPSKISMQSVYEGDEEPIELPSDYTPKQVTPVTSSPATNTQQEPPKPEPTPAATTPRDTMDSMKKNKDAMAAMADKFADKDSPADEEDSDESFEEVPKPIERPSAAAAKVEEKARGSEISKGSLASSTRADPTMQPSPTKASSPVKPASTPVTENPPPSSFSTKPTASAEPSASTLPDSTPSHPSSSTHAPTTTTTTTTASSAAQGLKDSLQEIKDMQLRTLSLLEAQQRTINKQMDQITFLSAELETLKIGFGEQRGYREKDETIRRLELEVEELRSLLS